VLLSQTTVLSEILLCTLAKVHFSTDREYIDGEILFVWRFFPIFRLVSDHVAGKYFVVKAASLKKISGLLGVNG
jgi:hypothetical protein